jgi:hypothetical protein
LLRLAQQAAINEEGELGAGGIFCAVCLMGSEIFAAWYFVVSDDALGYLYCVC